MNRIVIALLIAVLLTVGLLVGCGGTSGSGNLVTREIDLAEFSRVDAGPAFDIEIVQSNSYSIVITTDDNLLKYVEAYKDGETLKLGLKSGPHNFTTLKADIAMPNLNGLYLSGATRATVKGFNSSHNLIVWLSGASRVSGDITAHDAEFNVSGASTVRLEGSANDMIIEASAASNLDLGDFTVSNAEVKLSGASKATLSLYGRLDADVSGASDLSYIGEPTMGNVSISGASTLNKK